MVKRLVLVVFLLLASIRTEALEYTDVYYDPNEPGWGVTHFGRLYPLGNGQSSCTGPGFDTSPHLATIDSRHPTGQGSKAAGPGSLAVCSASFHFAAVLNVNN